MIVFPDMSAMVLLRWQYADENKVEGRKREGRRSRTSQSIVVCLYAFFIRLTRHERWSRRFRVNWSLVARRGD